jgi:chaperonin GroES
MSVKQLQKWANSEKLNIVDEFSDDELSRIGNRVLAGFHEDETSCTEWMDTNKRIEELVSLNRIKKTTPLPNSANVKLPLIQKAIYEYSSRTYPELFKDGSVVKGRRLGKDPQGHKLLQAERCADFMNYQLLYKSTKWEQETDLLLHLVGLYGFICRKTYYDPIRKENKSIICQYKDLIINSDEKSLEDARRVSHILHLSLNDLVEGRNTGVYRKSAVNKLIAEHENDDVDAVIDVIEQHTWIDLDKDNYQEPYVISILRENGEVLRIVPRFYADSVKEGTKGLVLPIEPIQYFTDYHFLVDPKGKFQSVGFGMLLLDITECANTTSNQILDAGQLANMRGGYMDSRLQPLGSGETLHDQGEWKRLKSLTPMAIKEGIYPIEYKEPSSVLLQMLEMLIQTAKELTSSTEVMTGSASPENAKTGATAALMQQGLKIFTSIQKRIYRSLCSEFRKLFVLNSIYLDEEIYYNVLDDEKAVLRQDFDPNTVDIIPVADPNLSSEVQRSMKNQLLIAAQALPGIDPLKITQRILENSLIENPEELMADPNAPQPPNPELMKIEAETQFKQQELQLKAQDLALKERQLQLQEKQFQLAVQKQECDIVETKSKSIKNLADAEAAEAGVQMQQYQQQMQNLHKEVDGYMEMEKMGHEQTMQDQEHAIRLEELRSAERVNQSMGGEQSNSSVDPNA